MAQAPTPEQIARVCEVTPVVTPEDFVLNASTGITSGFLKHRKSDRVRLIIRDKNPFLYEYKVTVAETAVPEPDLGAFLRLFGGPAIDLLPAAAAPAAPAAPAAGVAGAPAGQPDPCQTKFKLIVDQQVVVAGERDKVDKALERQRVDYDKLAVTVKAAEEAFKSNAVCVNLFTHAVTVRNAIAAYDPKLDAFGERIAVLSAAINLQDAYLRAFPADCAQNPQVDDYRQINRELPEYLVGPSIAFAEDRAFFTIGVYGGRLQELQNQIYAGGPIAKDLATIPVEKNLHWKLGGAITWKIR